MVCSPSSPLNSGGSEEAGLIYNVVDRPYLTAARQAGARFQTTRAELPVADTRGTPRR